MAAKIRKNFEFHPNNYKELQALKKLFHAESDMETVRRSIKLAKALLEMRGEGGSIIVKPKGGMEKEVCII